METGLELSETSMVPQRNFQAEGRLRAEKDALIASQATRRRIAAMRMQQVHCGDRRASSTNEVQSKKMQAKSVLDEPPLGAESEDVARAHESRQQAHVVALSDSFWRRQNYGRRFREKPSCNTELDLRVRDLRLGVLDEHTRGTHHETMRSVAIQSAQCKEIMGGPRDLHWPLGERPGGARHDKKSRPALESAADAMLSAQQGSNLVCSQTHTIEAPARQWHLPRGAQEFLDQYEHAGAFPNENLTAAFNCPYAEVYRHVNTVLSGGDHDEDGAEIDNQTLAERALHAGSDELISLAPRIEALAFEMRKEDALRVAERLGAVARSVKVAKDVDALHRAAISVISSIASRARDAHGLALPIEALEVMPKIGVGAWIYVDMLLAAVHVQVSRGQTLSLDMAERVAQALFWAIRSLNDSSTKPLTVGPAGRRVVSAIIDKLQRESLKEDLLGHVAELSSVLAE